jgi:hypothetical protein
VILGQDRAVDQFAAAWASRKLHHAWLLAGPKGVGKSTFAQAAARRVLGDAAGPPIALAGIDSPDEHPIVKLVEARSHPDFRWLERLVNEKTGNLNRNISVDQIRELGEFLNLSAALSSWRVVVIDSVDELETSGANALLKMLEEPPPNTLFFLVSHAPGAAAADDPLALPPARIRQPRRCRHDVNSGDERTRCGWCRTPAHRRDGWRLGGKSARLCRAWAGQARRFRSGDPAPRRSDKQPTL